MSATITLRPVMLDALRTGRKTIGVADSAGQRVLLFTKATWPSTTRPPASPAVVLSVDDLDRIEQTPDGLTVADATGWTIRMEGR